MSPRPGSRLHYKGAPFGVVVRVEGNLCFMKYDDTGEVLPFIWRFKEGTNPLFDWPGKLETGATNE